MGSLPDRRQQFNDDGTPRRKYELDAQADPRMALRVAFGLVLANALLLAKNVLFGEDAAKAQTQALSSSEQASERSMRSSDTGVDATLTINIDDSAAGPDRLDGRAAGPTIQFMTPGGMFGGSLNLYAADARPAAPHAGGAVNDNVALYRATPGNAITAFLDENFHGSNSTGRSGDAGSNASGSVVGVIKAHNSSNKPPVTPPHGPPVTPDATGTGNDPGPRANRLPTVTAPVFLGTLLTNQTIVLALSSFLDHASDPDGDNISVSNLSVSSGKIDIHLDQGLVFASGFGDASELTFTYGVSDGTGATAQTAMLELLPTVGNTITGTAGADVLIGTSGNDVIIGGGGNDMIVGLGGHDIVFADSGHVRFVMGDGDDVVHGGAGNDVVFAGGGNDVVFGGGGNDIIFGEDGNDILLGEDGDDTISGGAGNDLVDGGAGKDALHGDTGDDLVMGGADDDDIDGGDGQDVIDGGTGDDTAQGGNGNDTFIATKGDSDDDIDGGSDTDTYDASGTSAALDLNLATGTANSADVGHDALSGIENVKSGSGDDHVTGSDDANEITGGAGSDTAEGGGGDDTFIATKDDGDDHYSGGTGTDTYDATCATADLTVDLVAGKAISDDTGNDTVAQIENVKAGSGDDHVAGSDDANEITGGAGSDTADGSGGDDTFVATMNDGDDHYGGASGSDTYDASSTTADLTVDLTTGTATSSDVGHDTLTSIENVDCGSGDDTVVANDNVNIFSGGAGNDTFVFGSVQAIGKGSGSRDKILDFEVGDRIDLDNISKDFADVIDATFTDQSIRHFVLIGLQDKFTEPGQMKIEYADVDGQSSTLLIGNINFDQDAEFELEISGVHKLIASDFVQHS